MTTQQTHTPGPWEVEVGLKSYVIRSLDTEGLIITNIDAAIKDSDARLIAAAPELYAALLALHSAVPSNTIQGRLMLAAHDALSKAEGRE